jgi:hypothetical protein
VGQIAATITIDDEAAPDFFAALVEMEIEEDHRLAGCCKIKLAVSRQDDGSWTFLDDDRVRPWKPITISAEVADASVDLFAGYVVDVKPSIDAEEDQSFVEIWGMDATSLMSLEEKIRDWPNKSDSDIARQIFADYDLTPKVDDTGVVHDEKVSTIIQRETDIQFLKRLARRNGFECLVAGDTGYFRKPVLNEPPQAVLAAHFGDDTNLVRFDARLAALRPTSVEMHQIDTIGKQLDDAVVEASDQPQLGRDGATSLTVPNGISARMFVKHAMATSRSEMENLCHSLYDEAEWLIEATGEIDTLAYGDVLRPRKLVPIKGVGELFSGVYYVTNVKHVFSLDGYVQQFTARRNALAPKSAKDFGGDAGLFGLSL